MDTDSVGGSVLEELLQEPRVHTLQHLQRFHPSKSGARAQCGLAEPGVHVQHFHMHTKPGSWDSHASLVGGSWGL